MLNRHNSGRFSYPLSELLRNYLEEEATALVYDGIVRANWFQRLQNAPVSSRVDRVQIVCPEEEIISGTM